MTTEWPRRPEGASLSSAVSRHKLVAVESSYQTMMGCNGVLVQSDVNHDDSCEVLTKQTTRQLRPAPEALQERVFSFARIIDSLPAFVCGDVRQANVTVGPYLARRRSQSLIANPPIKELIEVVFSIKIKGSSGEEKAHLEASSNAVIAWWSFGEELEGVTIYHIQYSSHMAS